MASAVTIINNAPVVKGELKEAPTVQVQIIMPTDQDTSGFTELSADHFTDEPKGISRETFMSALQDASRRNPNLEWLTRNPGASGLVHEGLEESRVSKGEYLGSFDEFANDDE